MDSYDNEIQSPWEDIDDANNFDFKLENEIIDVAKSEISEVYDNILEERNRFMEKHRN